MVEYLRVFCHVGFFGSCEQPVGGRHRVIAKALRKLAKAATNEDWRQAFEQHLKETETQINRLDEVFEELHINTEAMTASGNGSASRK